MGCDIHLYVETKKDGHWQPADKWAKSKYDEGDRLTVSYEDRFYSGRNYNLFAILANVRNGSGFAGVRTGEGFNPIAEPRGLPDDVTPLITAESESWGVDGHSHSHFTVAELLAYDWTQTTKLSGWVDAYNFYKWDAYLRQQGEMPESYCGGVSGGGVKHVTQDEMRALLAALQEKLEPIGGWPAREFINEALPQHYCEVEQAMPYYRSVRHFWSDVMPRLLRLGKPEDVRIVFWFDN